MRAQVQAALEEIRPYIQADGGDVELVGVDDGIVTIKMTGHCVGCPSSQVTLRQGIETHLRKRVPDIVEVVQAPVTQQVAVGHAPVTSPFATGQAVGAAPAPQTVTTNLRDMHRKAEVLLSQLEGAVESIAGGQGKPEDVKTIEDVIDFLKNELMTHMRQEDEVLFPALIPFISWGSPMSVMAKEHRIINDEITELSTALASYKAGSGDPGALARVAKRVSQRLRDDFYQEENVLFVEADESIVGSRAKALKEAMDRIAAAAERDAH